MVPCSDEDNGWTGVIESETDTCDEAQGLSGGAVVAILAATVAAVGTTVAGIVFAKGTSAAAYRASAAADPLLGPGPNEFGSTAYN